MLKPICETRHGKPCGMPTFPEGKVVASHVNRRTGTIVKEYENGHVSVAMLCVPDNKGLRDA